MQQERVPVHCGPQVRHIVRKGATDKPPKRMANVLVSLTEAIGLEGRRDRPCSSRAPWPIRCKSGGGRRRPCASGVTTSGVPKDYEP